MDQYDVVLGLIISIIAAAWVYNDAQKRELKVPYIWGIMAFVFGIIGLFLYLLLIIRPNKRGV